MNTKLTIGIVAAIVIVGGGILLTSQNPKAPEQLTMESGMSDSTMKKGEEGAMDTAEDKMMMDDSMVLGVIMKSGKLLSLWPHNEIMELTHDLVLKNGTKVTKTGVITLANGKTVTLTEGQQLATTGEITTMDTSKLTMMEGMADSKDTDMMEKDAVMMAKNGEYMDYSAATAAAESAEGHKVVLFFHAPWCPFCKAADTAFKAKLDQIPANVVVLKTDYDSNTALKQKYGVTYQHTFVQIDKDGNLVTKWNGGDLANLIKFIK